MKIRIFISLVVFAALISCSGNGSNVKNYTEADSVSYILGFENTANMIESKADFPGGELNVDEYINGFVDGLDSVDAQLMVDDVRMFLNRYAMRAQQKASERGEAMSQDSTLDIPEYVDVAVDSASYFWGFSTGQQFHQGLISEEGKDLNADVIKLGLKDAQKGNEPKVSVENPEMFINQYFQRAQMEAAKAADEKAKAEAAPKLAEIEKFMSENAQEPGVIVHESGKFQYKVLEEGNGPKPTPQDNVTVHYKGTFLDGQVFDSSYERGEPATFGLQNVIRGWTEGVPLMSVGSKYKFWIHPDYAYGPRDRGSIPGSSLLVFEIELISIN